MIDHFRKQLVAALSAHLQSGQPPIVPESGRDLWRIFIDLSRTRTYHMAGPNPIAHREIEAYARLHRWPLQPRHVEVIVALDAAWLEHAYSKRDKTSAGVKTLPRHSGQAVNPAVFDAVFP